MLRDAIFRRCCPVSGTLVEPDGKSRRVTFSEMIYLWNPVLLSAVVEVDKGQHSTLVKEFAGMITDAASSEEAIAICNFSTNLVKDISIGTSCVGQAIMLAFNLTKDLACGVPIVGGVLQVLAGIKDMVEAHLRTQELGKRTLVWITSVIAMLINFGKGIQVLKGHIGKTVEVKMDRCIGLANQYRKVLDREFCEKKTLFGKFCKQVKGVVMAGSLEKRLKAIQGDVDRALSDLLLDLNNSMLEMHIVSFEKHSETEKSMIAFREQMKIVADIQKPLGGVFDSEMLEEKVRRRLSHLPSTLNPRLYKLDP